MVEKRFEKLGMPDIERFENYLPTAFNSELTLLQKVNKIIFDLIETNKLTNEMVDYLNKFIEKFDGKLYKTVEDVLKVWLDDGLLADIVREAINDEVIEARTDYLGKKYVNLKERLDSEKADIVEVTAQLTQYANEEVVANRLGLQRGQDLAVIIQSLLDNQTIGKVRVLEGDYTLSKKIVIPEGKELILSGDNGANFLNNSEADPSVFTKVHPTFDGDYCFEISNRSSLKGGFINCEGMTSGGAVLVDFSQKEVGRAVIKTNIAGDKQWGITGIMLNGDRPVGTTPGFGFYIDIECGIDRVGTGVHLKRHDSYTSVDKTINGLAWINGLKISGEMNGCQRYVFFDTSVNEHAGGSSRINCRLQGGYVPNPNTPAVELGGNDSFLDCIFHDIANVPYTNQKVRYRIKGAHTTVMKEFRGSPHIIDDATQTTVYLAGSVNNRPSSITALDDGSPVEDGWYIRAENVVTISLRLPTVAITSGWEKILTLPIPSTSSIRGYALGTGGKTIAVWIFGSNLSIVADEAVGGAHIQFSYPVK